jgi:hypothetical protein
MTLGDSCPSSLAHSHVSSPRCHPLHWRPVFLGKLSVPVSCSLLRISSFLTSACSLVSNIASFSVVSNTANVGLLANHGVACWRVVLGRRYGVPYLRLAPAGYERTTVRSGAVEDGPTSAAVMIPVALATAAWLDSLQHLQPHPAATVRPSVVDH